MSAAKDIDYKKDEWQTVSDDPVHLQSLKTFLVFARQDGKWYYYAASNKSSANNLNLSDFDELKIICHETLSDSFEIDTGSQKAKIKTFSKEAELFLFADGKIRLQLDAGKTKVSNVDPIAPVSKPLTKKKRIFILDDSPVIRKIIKSVLQGNPEFEIAGESGDPVEALEMLKDSNLKIDAMTVDIHMPSMLGSEFIEKLYKFRFIPSIIVSSLSLNEGTKVLDALEAGAIDYVQKPTLEEIDKLKDLLCDKLTIAANAKKSSIDVHVEKDHSQFQGVSLDPNKIILIGASTGGTEAIRDVLVGLPANVPPILIVQHIPPYFSKAFADRLNELCAFEVREGKDGDVLQPGVAYVAPGGYQMELDSSQRPGKLKIYEGEKVSGHKPSVDVLFGSVQKSSAKRSIALLMTGMGSDGSKMLKQLKDFGAHTMIQDESSSVVYGMPKAAKKLNAHVEELALDQIANGIIEKVKLNV